jgi:deferrochelatase/peroxidase EfeB
VKTWLAELTDPAEGLLRPDESKRSTASVTLAFSWAGLRALGVDYHGPVDDPFADGMRARARQLGDVDESDPRNWQSPWNADGVHVLIWVEADDQTRCDSMLAKLQALDRHHALTWLGVQRATMSGPNGQPVDQLGFRDGISQPWLPLKGQRPDRQREPGGTFDAFGNWRPLAIGEFVLGERDESGDVSRVPEPAIRPRRAPCSKGAGSRWPPATACCVRAGAARQLECRAHLHRPSRRARPFER